MSTAKELIIGDMQRLTAKGSPVVTAPQLAALLKRPSASVRRNLAELAIKGIVRKEGQGYVLSGVKRLSVAPAVRSRIVPVAEVSPETLSPVDVFGGHPDYAPTFEPLNDGEDEIGPAQVVDMQAEIDRFNTQAREEDPRAGTDVVLGDEGEDITVIEDDEL